MTFHLLGAGLRGTRSITVEENEVLGKCSKIYIDTYTSIFPENFINDLSGIYSGEIIPLEREELESMAFIKNKNNDSALIVSGDPFGSTTHMSIARKCIDNKIELKIYENASIISIIWGRTGLSAYRSGSVVSIPDFGNEYIPASPYEKILQNITMGLHTLVLVDLKNGKNIDSSRLMEILTLMRDRNSLDDLMERAAFSIERAGWNDEAIHLDSLENILRKNLRSPYCIVIPGKMDFNERENIKALFPDCSRVLDEPIS